MSKPPALVIKGCKRCGGDIGRDFDDITMTWEQACLQCGRNPNPIKTLPRLGGSDKRRTTI